MDILGERWTFLILRESFYGVRRFSDMQRNLGIARNILCARLQTLVGAGILERRRYQEEPERFEYRLTAGRPRPVSRDHRDHALGRRAPQRPLAARRAAPLLRRAGRPRARVRALRGKPMHPHDVTPVAARVSAGLA